MTVTFGADLMEPLLQRARTLVGRAGTRVVVGMCGAPGAGKSTLADALVAAYGPGAVVVPMDGFHLHDEELVRNGMRSRKGAPETFDVHGYLALLTRLRTQTDSAVYAPSFDRRLETALANTVRVGPEDHLVVTEGNYLLHDAPGWRSIRSLVDEVWFVEECEEPRLERLIQRHVAHGKTRAEATAWVTGTDQANAVLVARSRPRADLHVRLEPCRCRRHQDPAVLSPAVP